jgi:hypothetical protein
MCLLCQSITSYNMDADVHNVFSKRYINKYEYYVIYYSNIIYFGTYQNYLLCQSITIYNIDIDIQHLFS